MRSLGKMGVVITAGCALGVCVAAAVMVRRSVKRRRGWKRVAKVVEELEVACATPLGRLRQVVDAMAVEMHAGLASDGGSKLKMLITYVHNLPTGREKGTYYALDLGGTYIRVLRIDLAGERSSVRHIVHEQTIPDHLLTSTSEELFDFVAESLKTFSESEEGDPEHSQTEIRELGFTFSFPVLQSSPLSATLIKWTKGFSIKDMIGKDISQCLGQAMSRQGLNMRVAALINDTVGTLALSHYHDEDTVAAVTFGTGTNACYLERADAIIKSHGLLATSECMVVNMEWGSFWSSHLPRTSYDIELDSESCNPNEQGFEKLISGMYLGDIVRRVILRLSQESEALALALASSKLHTLFILTTPMVAAMHEDDSPDLSEVARILQETFEIPEVPLNIRKLIVKTCDIVTCRAAQLAAAGIMGILKKIGRDCTSGKDTETRRTVVAIDGSLYTNYRSFRNYLNEAMEQILGPDAASHVVLKVMKDGSGIGAAVLAAASTSSSSSSY